ncbi:MAG TPA: choice-of-anchor Q domain-containing protein, partial [Bacteroidia bacterium]
MKKLLLTLLCATAFNAAQSQITYVNHLASGLNDGTSWANAYTDLQTALTNTSSGTMWVAQGTYYPGASGMNAATFNLKNNVQILGGFNGTESGPSQRNPRVNITTLSGDLDGDLIANSNDAYHVVSAIDVNSSASIDGFSITQGYSTTDPGGGVYVIVTGSGTFAPLISNCDINGNYAANGGGVYIENSIGTNGFNNPMFINCIIRDNQASNAGGGVDIYAAGNFHNCAPYFENVLIVRNTASTGAAIISEHYSAGACNATFTNCTMQGNMGPDQIFFLDSGGGTLTFNNTSVWGEVVNSNAAINANYCNVTNVGDYTGGGNISLDPLYKNPAVTDYRLSCQSPNINSGNDTYVGELKDLQDSVRMSGAAVDIGAYETNYGFLSILPNASPSNTICAMDNVSLYGSGPGGVSYVWTGGVTDGIPFSPTITDTYTVTGTDINGCVATETITVTVNALPFIGINYSDLTVCMGGSLTLSGTGAQAYAWTHGVNDGVAFVPTTTETYTITGIDANGCQAINMITITVEDPSTVSAGPDIDACRSGTPFVTIAGNSGGAPNTSWTSLGSGSWFNSNTATPDYYFSGADALSASVTLVIEVQYIMCANTTDTMVITMQDPTISYAGTDISVCSNTSGVNLAGSPTNAGSVTWVSSGGGSFSNANATNAIYFPNGDDILAGQVTLGLNSYAVNPACPSDVDSVVIYINSSPVIVPVSDYPICQSDSIYLNANFSGGTAPYNYTWKTASPVVIISTGNSDYYYPGMTDTYDVQITDINGCSAVDTFTVYFDDSEDISGTINVGAGQLMAGTV